MEFSAKIILAFFLHVVYTVKSSYALYYYCEWSTCDVWEYCCGDNECCTKTDVACYVEIGAGIVFCLLFLFWALYALRRYSIRTGRPIAHIIFGSCGIRTRRRESSTANLATCDAENYERVLDPPPPYSEIMRTTK